MNDPLSNLEEKHGQQSVGALAANIYAGALAEADTRRQAFWATVAALASRGTATGRRPGGRMTVAPIIDALLEKEWDALLFNSQKGLAPMLGWRLVYHTLRSKGSQAGFPDRVLVRDRVIFAELKRDDGKPSPAQKEWLDGLAAAGAEAYLWRPADLNEIATILSKRWKFEKTIDGQRILRSELTSYMPQSLWVAGKGRADEATA